MPTNCTPDQTATELGCIPNDVGGFVSKFYTIGITIIAILALIGIIYGGYKLSMSNGNPMEIKTGRSYIMYSIIGIVLAIFATVLLKVIGVDILHIPGFIN